MPLGKPVCGFHGDFGAMATRIEAAELLLVQKVSEMVASKLLIFCAGKTPLKAVHNVKVLNHALPGSSLRVSTDHIPIHPQK